MMFLGGVVWPVEAIHPLLQPIASVFPITMAIEGLRSILQRGWGILAKPVYMGFISMSLWAIVMLTMSVLFLKFRKS